MKPTFNKLIALTEDQINAATLLGDGKCVPGVQLLLDCVVHGLITPDLIDQCKRLTAAAERADYEAKLRAIRERSKS